jgi:hypothetical protein
MIIIAKHMFYTTCIICFHTHIVMDILNDYQPNHGLGILALCYHPNTLEIFKRSL